MTYADTCYIMNKSSKSYALWKKPEGHIWYDCIYMKYPEWANLQRQKKDKSLSGTGGGGIGADTQWAHSPL